MRLVVALICMLLFCPSLPAAAQAGEKQTAHHHAGQAGETAERDQSTVAGLPAAEALRLGERMYRKGVLPSGATMTAKVQDGIEIDGKMTNCANCHLPSGLGSLEGGIVSTPTNGVKLYAPLRGALDIPGTTMKRSMYRNPARPAYSDQSLARALTRGLDPAGRTLNGAMPRYDLGERDQEILIYYLKNLSSQHSPGLTPDSIKFATIVTGEVSPADREAFLQPLKAYIRDDWNARVNAVSNQWDSLWNLDHSGPKAFRKIDLVVWELTGAPDRWREQLEAYYRQSPVFAVLGGISTGKWAPIHDFCEQNRIPCILPITDLPVISESDRYTIYVSKGVYQEGEAAAKYLSRVFALPAGAQIVQVFRDDERGQALAQGFTDTWGKLGTAPLVSRAVAPNQKMGADFWRKLSAAHPKAVLLLWLAPADLAGVGALAESGNKPLFFSSTLLDEEYAALPDTIRDFSFITYPGRLPDQIGYSKDLLNYWMGFKKLPMTNARIASQVFLIKNVLTDALLGTAGEFYREYFLDNMDESRDQLNSSITYPALTFGPGQRYASKGCYVVTVPKGDRPKVVQQSDWVIY